MDKNLEDYMNQTKNDIFDPDTKLDPELTWGAVSIGLVIGLIIITVLNFIF